LLVLAVVGGLLGAACGNIYLDAPSSGADAGISEPEPVAASGSATIPVDTTFSCPDARPDEDSPCDVVGAACEYGSSADSFCNATLRCEGDPEGLRAWTSSPVPLCPTNECPADTTRMADLSGKPCSVPSVDGGPPGVDDELLCNVADALCACTTGPTAANGHARVWVCLEAVGECAGRRPLAGRPCSPAGQECDYGACTFKHGVRMKCLGAVWVTGGSTTCG
jgi:hypothetical protein